MSRAVQVLMLGVLFVFAAAGCVFILVVWGGVDPTGSRVIFAGGALILLSGLAAAVSALGPKYRPSPFLTPLTAGVFAALLATTAVVSAAYSPGPAPKGKPAPARVAERRMPPAPQPKAKPPEPAAQTAALAQPQPPAPPPPPKPVRVLDASLDPAAVHAATPPAAELPPAPPPMVAAIPPEPPKPPPVPVDTMPAAAPAAQTESLDPAHVAAKKPVAVASVPNPRPAPTLPADADAPISLQAGFDTSTPAAKSAGQPLSLATIAGQSAQSQSAQPQSGAPVIPPLPRIRPCGAGGPACP